MRTITPLDLRRSLGRILDEASAGERFLIERDHRPLAVLVSVEEARRLDEPGEERRRRSLAALARLEAWSKQMARLHPSPPGAPDAVTLLHEEREARADRITGAVDDRLDRGRRPSGGPKRQ